MRPTLEEFPAAARVSTQRMARTQQLVVLTGQELYRGGREHVVGRRASLIHCLLLDIQSVTNARMQRTFLAGKVAMPAGSEPTLAPIRPRA